MKTIFSLAIALTFATSGISQTTQALTFGPMLHVNISNKSFKPSWGFEAAYWVYGAGFPVSIDLGFEFQKGQKRIYSELQTGLVLVGTSAGIYYQLNQGENNYFGFQANAWCNYFAGLNFRLRISPEGKVWVPGTYLKIPFGLSWLNEDWEERTKHNNSSGWDNLFD